MSHCIESYTLVQLSVKIFIDKDIVIYYVAYVLLRITVEPLTLEWFSDWSEYLTIGVDYFHDLPTRKCYRALVTRFEYFTRSMTINKYLIYFRQYFICKRLPWWGRGMASWCRFDSCGTKFCHGLRVFLGTGLINSTMSY